MRHMIFILSLILTSRAFAKGKSGAVLKQKTNKGEVVENPTLKTLSGSLNDISLYSSFVYRGGSLQDPTGAERPNILKTEGKPSLVNMTGNIGMKYRMSKSDNFSLQVGVYSTAPFHSEHDASSKSIQKDFDKNHQNIEFDDPTLSYFKTYYLGKVQNVSFVKYQHVTTEIYRDRGLMSAISLSHAAAIKLNKFMYGAASMTYENYHYDKDEVELFGRKIPLFSSQIQHSLRGNLSTEMYVRRNISFRLISDVFSFYRMRRDSENKKRGLQQTVAMTYFFNRDISLAPNVRFIAEDLRADRTNVGLTLNVSL